MTWMYHVVHNTFTIHGRDIKTRYIGSTSILLLRKDWNSIRLDRMQSFFKKHFQLIAFQKLLDWKLEKSYTTKYTCHLDFRPRSHWNTNGQRELGSKVARQPEGEVARQANFSNKPNQLQIQFVSDRGDLMTCKMEETRPVLKRSMLILLRRTQFFRQNGPTCWYRGKSNTFIWRQ